MAIERTKQVLKYMRNQRALRNQLMNKRIVKATVKQRRCQPERQNSIRFNKRNHNFAFVSHFW